MSGCHFTPGRRRDAERIVVVCPRYIGDTVLAIPFLRNLRRAFPAATIEACGEANAGELLVDCPYLDGFVPWPGPAGRREPLRSLATIRRQAVWLGRRGYTRAYLLKRSLSAAVVTALAGIPHRIGLAGEGRWLLTRAVHPPRGRHQAARYLDLLRSEGFALDDGHGENWITPAAAARVSAVLARLPAGRPRVFVAPQSTAATKHWPADRWAALVEWLVLRQGCEVVLCGGPLDLAAHDRLRSAVGRDVAGHVHDFTRQLSLRETGGLLARMDLCVGVDTGLVHLAASHGVPVAVLFGPTDPNQWSPWTARAVVVRSPRLNRPLAERLFPRSPPRPGGWPSGRGTPADIGVEEVALAVSSLLPDARPAAGGSQPLPSLRTLDLRQGSFRYEVEVGGLPSAVPTAASA